MTLAGAKFKSEVRTFRDEENKPCLFIFCGFFRSTAFICEVEVIIVLLSGLQQM